MMQLRLLLLVLIAVLFSTHGSPGAGAAHTHAADYSTHEQVGLDHHEHDDGDTRGDEHERQGTAHSHPLADRIEAFGLVAPIAADMERHRSHPDQPLLSRALAPLLEPPAA